jgi:DNA repair exonuclease SbcCD ATPase subunit
MSVWFEEVALDYGRHTGSFPLIREAVRQRLSAASGNGGGNGSAGKGNGHRRGTGDPFVILGPNGAGKSTLVEAPVRALFGFKRSRKEGREAHAQRQPWIGGPYRAAVRVRTPNGVFTFERDFETDRIRVSEEGRQSPVFDAEANPSRTGEAVRQYRAILRETIGLDDFDHYRETACIFQGGLLTSGLSGDLLRVAAGGHTDVESAHALLRKEYAPITVEPIAPAASRRRKPGRTEAISDQIADLESRVAGALAAEERRTPLVRSREDALARLESISAETARLEAAFETLSEGHRLEVEAEAARARIRSLENAQRRLDEAVAAFNLVVVREESHTPRYPLDFAERARALEEGLWPSLAGIEEETVRLHAQSAPAVAKMPVALVTVAGLLVLGGLVLTIFGATTIGVGALMTGIGVGGFLFVRERARGDRADALVARGQALESRRADVEARISRLTRDLPDATALTPEMLPAARREFEREAADRRLRDEAEGAVRQALDAARQAIRLHEEGAGDRGEAPTGFDPDTEGASEVPDEARDLADRARARLEILQEAVARERDEHMAPLRLRLNEIARSRFELPADVEPELDAVRIARRDRLARAGEAQAELASLERELASEGRVDASALSLQRELTGLRAELETVEDRAAAYRAAYSLVADAYEAFRTTDEERLLGAISAHLEQVSGGELGPIEAVDGLDKARVRIRGRAVALTSPPLSYGQLHAALLSVRLGAADFLAGLGVGLPFLIDDPFVHLDERAVEDLWTVLCRIAGSRQIVVATQDRLVLDYLGVTPDLELARPDSSVIRPTPEPGGADDQLDRTEGSSAAPNRVEGEVLDLWGDPEDSES